jgi:hypothetical protein
MADYVAKTGLVRRKPVAIAVATAHTAARCSVRQPGQPEAIDLQSPNVRRGQLTGSNPR